MSEELEDILDLLMDEEYDFSIKHNNRVWGVSYQPSNYVYNSKGKAFGKVTEQIGENRIRVRYEDGKVCLLNILHYLKRREVFFVYPRGNVSYNFLVVCNN